MALKNTISGIVHHARPSRAHFPTMVSSFKLSSRQSTSSGFVVKLDIYKKTNLRFVASTRCIAALVEDAVCATHTDAC